MSEHPRFWFHCGRCGTLFQSKAGEDELRLCANCGEDPSTGLPELPSATVPAENRAPDPEPETSPEGPENRGKRGSRKRKKSHLMLKLFCGWLLVLAVILIGARKMFHRDTPDRPGLTTDTRTDFTPSDEDMKLLEDVLPLSDATFAAFLNAGVPEQRNQFVINPLATVSRMARFDDLNPIIQIDPRTIGRSSVQVIRFPDGKAIETLWQSTDGRKFDAVFREESGEWRLDWEHFVRFGDYPWSLFLAGADVTEGEFRLLARERLAKERKNEETISLVLYAPRFGNPGDTGFQSPEFLVSRKSRDGRLLDAAFKLEREGRRVFDSRLGNIDPDEMIRVRVRVKRIEGELARTFQITEVLACHWYSVEDPGVNPDAAAKETPPETLGITPVEFKPTPEPSE